MEHLTIDQKKCVKCNLCVQDCPMGIPAIDNEGNYVCDEKNACVCIYCGHCVTVCPAKAIVLNKTDDANLLNELQDYGVVPLDLNPKDCLPTELENIPRPEQMESLIRSRRMTRSFKKDLVKRETIEHVFNDVLVYAPSGHNIRGFEATIVEGREKLDILTGLTCDCFADMLKGKQLHSFDNKVFERIVNSWEANKIDRIFRSANQVVIVHCKSSYVPADPAVKVLLTYFELLANTMGLGTVWAGYFMVAASFYEPIKKFLGIPAGNTVYGAMMYGYPDCTYNIIPKRPDIKMNYIK